MKSESAQSRMEAVSEVAKLAGEVALRHFREGVKVELKPDRTPVTEADRDAERTARRWIEERFPEDGILGEEFGETRPGARRRWVLDPIDGTKTFVRGVPLWGTLVALMEGEEVLAGAAYFPPVQERLVAAPGAGAYWNGNRCQVSQVAQLAEATVLSTDTQFRDPERARRWGQLTAQAQLCRTWGDCYGYLLLATGRAEVMTDDVLSPWDAAAIMPIIEEAGGSFTDWNGKRTCFGGSALGTNGALSKQVRELLIR